MAHSENSGLSTGCERLDGLMDGGVPRGRTLLVSGEPGTGKTTLAMQFLQTGLDRGEDCLFVSTEQTVDELADTFDPYPFDLGEENLTVVTVHAEPGETFDGEEGLVVRTLEEGNRTVTEWFDLPFTRQNVVEYLSEFAPADRIALDSVSGIRPMAAERVSFWRSVYDLIRLFGDSFGATSLLTAGDTEASEVATDLVRYATHGTVDLEWVERNGNRARFLRVTKMRGRDHDDRRHRLVLTDRGASVEPTQRTPPARLLGHDHLSTGVAGLDDLLGGGLVRGGLSLFTHDGTTGYYTLLTRALANAAANGMALAVTLPAEVSLDALDRYWASDDADVSSLLENDRLFVLELVESTAGSHRNVMTYDPEGGRDWEGLMERVYERSGDRPLFALVDTEPLLEVVSDERARAVRYRAAARHTGEDDVVVYTVNPKMQDDRLVEFLVDTSQQTIEIERAEDGLEWLTLRKSPTGTPGQSELLAYREQPPYVDLV